MTDAELQDWWPDLGAVAAEPRYQRCAVQASNGSFDRLAYYVNLLKIDYRDVVMAGEYEHRNGNLARARNLIAPFETVAQNNPAGNTNE